MHSPAKSVDPARVLHPELLAPHKIVPGQARVIGCPNPFTAKCVDGWCPAGITVREAVAGLAQSSGIPQGWARHAHIWLDGRKVHRSRWDEVQVRGGQLLNFRIVPGKSGGGGGKNPLRMVMSIAVMAAAWYAGPALLGQMGLGVQVGLGNMGLAMGIGYGGGLAVGSAVIGGGVALLGNSLVDAIAPVSNSASSSSGNAATESAKSAYSLSGSSNSARKYEPIAVVLGRIRRPADPAASPYSEASGSDQWGHYLFSWGIGPLAVTDMKLGDTPLAQFLKSSTRDIMPEMEASTTATTTISASVNSAEAWRLGNNSRNTTTSGWNGGNVLPVDVDIDLGSIRGMQGYSLRPHATYPTYMPAGWTIYGGKTADDLAVLDVQSAQVWPDGAKKDYELAAVHQVRHLRVRFTAAGAAGTLFIDELEILGGLLVESWEGREGDAKPTLYTGNTHEESIGAQLPWEDFESQEPTVRYTEPGCTGFEIELYGNQGLWRLPPGGSLAYGMNVTLEALYRRKGTTDELKRVGAQSDAGWVVSVAGVNERADRRACRFTLPSGDLEQGQYEIHLRRIARDYGNSSPDDGTIFDSLYWSVLRTFRPGDPVTLEIPWAGSALCVQANEDFSGSLPVLTGICASECLDWDAETQTWITRQTSNPASLLRYWLQHPCRLKPWTDARIDIAKLERWHEFCAAKGFEFNGEAVIRGKSIMTVARMICAAGRGSPLRPNGIFSVVWDDVQDEIVQVFNDRNSWGFKAERKFAKIPHALRVSFQDEDNDFEEDEIIIYDDGYDSSNATLFESTSFDGVTNADQIWKMGRNYLAQLRLRPWKYSTTTSMEYLIGGRGKLVAMASATIKVGLVSARVKSVTWDEDEEHVLSVKLDQVCAMEAGKSYALRYRRSDAVVVVRTVDFVEFETQVLTFTEPVLAVIAPQEDSLCTFGVSGEDSLTVLVEAIIPGEDDTATVTGVDYSPAIFTADTGTIPPWEGHITQPIYGRKVATPVIDAVRSGSTAMLFASDGTATLRMEVIFSIPSGGLAVPTTLEAQMRQQGMQAWSDSVIVPISQGSLYLSGVEADVAYELRVRAAVSDVGLVSEWSGITTHTVDGSVPVPAAPSGLTASILRTGVALAWSPATEPWVTGNDVALSGVVLEQGYGGNAYLLDPLAAGPHDVSVRARDSFGQVGEWATATVTPVTPAAPVVASAIVGMGILYDITPPDSSFELVGYMVREGADWATGAPLGTITGTTHTIAAGAAGTVRRWFAAVDKAGNVGTPSSVDVTVLAPSAPSVTAQITGPNIEVAWVHNLGSLPLASSEILHGATLETATSLGAGLTNTSVQVPGAAGAHRFWVRDTDAAGNPGPAGMVELVISSPGQVSITPQVIDNNVLLAWTEAKGTLPIADCELRRGATYATSTLVGRISGRFATIFETASGAYTYWITQRDVAGNDGAPASITVQVSQPPDYVLRDDFTSVFSGTIANALLESGGLVMPVNTTSTVAEVMAAGGWATRQDKITAGLDYRLEPTPATSSYQEVIDYGTTLSGTKISVIATSQVLDGSVSLSCRIEISVDGAVYTDLGEAWQAFASNFRYCRITITATPDGGSDDLLRLSALNVKLDVKNVTDSGSVTCSAADPNGTRVPFNLDFLDVNSIVLTSSDFSVYRALYSFVDIPHPTGFFVLLYDSAGSRVSGNCSWQARGAMLNRNYPAPVMEWWAKETESLVNGTPDGFTFTRASAAYRTNASGYLESVASGTLRHDYALDGTYKGWLIEASKNNYCLYNRDLTNAAWAKTNCTAAKDQTGPDNAANSCSSVTATAANATILQARALAAQNWIPSAYLKRITGTGAVSMTVDGGTTWTDVTAQITGTGPNGFSRVRIPYQNLATPSIGFKLATSGDAIAVDLVQMELSTNDWSITSPIATTSAGVTRAADVLSVPTASISGFSTTEGCLSAEFDLNDAPAGAVNYPIPVSLDDGTVINRINLQNNLGNGVSNLSMACVSGGTIQGNTLLKSGTPVGVMTRAAFSFKADDFKGRAAGQPLKTDAAGAIPAVTQLQIGRSGAAYYLNGHVKHFAYFNRSFSAEQIAALLEV